MREDAPVCVTRYSRGAWIGGRSRVAANLQKRPIVQPAARQLGHGPSDDSSCAPRSICCRSSCCSCFMPHRGCVLLLMPQETFDGANSFNHPIGNWDTARVTTLFQTFRYAFAFDQPLPWNVALVTDLTGTFAVALSFNQPLPWNTASVTTLFYTFNQAHSFNQPLLWDTSSVTILEVRPSCFRPASCCTAALLIAAT